MTPHQILARILQIVRDGPRPGRSMDCHTTTAVAIRTGSSSYGVDIRDTDVVRLFSTPGNPQIVAHSCITRSSGMQEQVVSDTAPSGSSTVDDAGYYEGVYTGGTGDDALPTVLELTVWSVWTQAAAGYRGEAGGVPPNAAAALTPATARDLHHGDLIDAADGHQYVALGLEGNALTAAHYQPTNLRSIADPANIEMLDLAAGEYYYAGRNVLSTTGRRVERTMA